MPFLALPAVLIHEDRYYVVIPQTKKLSAHDTKITNEFSSRLFKINASFTAELAEEKSINSRDAGYANGKENLINNDHKT